MIVSLSHLRAPAAFAALMACSSASQNASKAPAPAAAPDSTPAAAPTATAPAPAATAPDWLVVDTATKTATLTLQVTAPPDAPSALINGYRAGQARIVVPVGWTVKWDWRNADPTSPHSLVVMVQREKIPLEGGRPAFSNAMTRMVTAGLPPDATDQTTFVAEEAGWYWMMCGVPNHALKGEWLELRVDPEAKAPSVSEK
jgi:sulfocyanin SoxE-like protein